MSDRVGHDLWIFPESQDFGESVAGSDVVIPLPPDTVLLKAVHLAEAELAGSGLEKGRQRLVTVPPDGDKNVYLFRPVPSSDGPPFRAGLIYVLVQPGMEIQRYASVHLRQLVKRRASRYGAVRVGLSPGWEQDFALGRPAFFLTGSGGTALWRLARLEADALNRLVLTLQPVRLAHGLAVPSFDQVSDTALRAYLTEQFEAFQRAVASGAHLEVVDRSANIAEGVLDYCLSGAGRDVPRTLAERLTAARGVLEEKELRGKFPLTSHAYHLAHKIRELHARIHADQGVQRGETVRPEEGMSVAGDLSRLLVEVGLARY